MTSIHSVLRTKAGKILSGISSILPLVALIVFLAVFARVSVSLVTHRSADYFLFEVSVWLFITCTCVGYALMALFLVDVHSQKLSNRTMWTILLLFVTLAALPLYWYSHILPSQSPLRRNTLR
jgi:hypothetical protein